MLYQVAAIAAFAGLTIAAPQAPGAFNAGDGLVRTVTTFTTQEVTVTSCAASVTDCPATVSMTSYPVVTTVAAVVPVPANNAAVTGATGTGAAGAFGGNTNTYNVPALATGAGGVPANGAYSGPSYTGAASQVQAGAAVAAVAAVAALII